jgi:hypothetical protein
MSDSNVHEQALAYCRKYGLAMRTSPGKAEEPALRAQLQAIADQYVALLTAMFGGSFEILESESREIIQIDRLDKFDVTAVAAALGEIDYNVEVTRLLLGIDGAPVASEIHTANMRKVMTARGKPAKPSYWQPADVARALREQGLDTA